MHHWILKTEPDVLSIQKLEKMQRTPWDGVRNYQARNYMMKDMKEGDRVFIYHSSCDEIGIAGMGIVDSKAYPDPTQFDKKSEYFDEKASKDKPRWFLVEIKWLETFKKVIPLSLLKETKGLDNLVILKKGNRLSITPVTVDDFRIIEKLK